jgi:hypothetical protein
VGTSGGAADSGEMRQLAQMKNKHKKNCVLSLLNDKKDKNVCSVCKLTQAQLRNPVDEELGTAPLLQRFDFFRIA